MSFCSSIRRGGLLFLSAALFSSCLGAQQSSKPARDTDVHALARRVDQHYNKLHSLKAGFTESYVGLGMRRQESGTLLLVKPGRMRWDYSSPAGKLFLLDSKYAWFYTQGDAQVQRIEAKKLDDLRSPLRFLLGHTQLEKELTNLTFKPAPNGQFSLTGQPKGQENRIPRLTLMVTADGAITAIEIEEVDGAITSFVFSGEVPNAPAPPGAFHFTPPPGVPVIDALPPV
jgi:outer membrane lipoprotein carrier protein